VKKTNALSNRYVNKKANDQKNPLATIAIVALLGTFLAACETSQMLDVSNLLSTDSKKTASAPAPAQKTPTKLQKQNETVKAETEAETEAEVEVASEENVVLRGPVANAKSSESAYPSLSDQPEKPENTLSKTQKDQEINALKNLSATHVQDREDALETRSIRSLNAKKPDEGIFGLGWLNSGPSSVAKKGKKGALTPPEKLRLARTRAAASGIDDDVAPDNISTDSSILPGVKAGLRRTPIIPSVPEKEETAAKTVVAKTSAPRKIITEVPSDAGNRPSAQAPKMIQFSDGSRKLTQSQQKPLDEIAQFGNDSGSNIYVLGFSKTDPQASTAVNIDSQDLAISRANYVADGLRKRGFSADHVVVQIIDELPEKGKKSNAAINRVEVYFENSRSLKSTVSAAPKRAKKKSRLDFLKGKPFEYTGNDN